MPKNRNVELKKNNAASGLSRKKLWAFRITAMVVVPLIFLGGLEVILRLAGFGYDTNAIIEQKLNGKDVCCNNPKFGWRFFQHNIAREFYGFVFDAEKPPGTYRIFVLGASAAQGVPEPAYNFGRILEVMLNQRYPQTRFEVITTAITAINSHVVLEIAKDCAGYDPDLFIVYLGNNEVVGPFGPGTVLSSTPPGLSFIRANIALKLTRIGQLADRILSLAAPHGTGPKRWDGMAMFLGKQVHYDSPDLELVYSYFEQNLDDICKAARRAGADVIISNVGCNLKDCPPFASLHKETLSEAEKQKWQEFYQQGIDNENAGEFQQAIENYLSAAEIDQTFADLQFRLGRCCWNTGQYETAKEQYFKAREYDTLRFRADDGINQTVRSTAERKTGKGVYFVDSVAALEENSPHNTPGEELFYEHVHLNFSGNYVVARTLLARIDDILPATAKQHPGAVLSEEQCAERLTYTPVDRCLVFKLIEDMTCDAPFTNQLYHNEFMGKIKQEIEELRAYSQHQRLEEILNQYKQAVEQKPNDWHLRWRLAQVLRMAPQPLKAIEFQYKKIIELCPYVVTAHLKLGVNLRQQGNYNEALTVLKKLLDIKPNSADAHYEIAEIYRGLKDYKNTIRHLKASLAIESSKSADIYAFLAESYYLSGDINKAIDTLYKAIGYFPEEKTAIAHAYLGYLFGRQGEYKKALAENKLVLKIDPNYVNQKGFKEYMDRLEKIVNP